MKSHLTILVLVIGLLALTQITASAAGGVSIESKSLKITGKVLQLRIVQVPLDTYKPKVGLAQGRVGGTESLEAMVKRNKAVAGINGSFFDAYSKGQIKPPYHHIATDGEFVHLGNTGTTLGFDSNGHYRMEQVKITLRGGLNNDFKYPNNWYAYFINHPTKSRNSATIYTRHWMSAKTPAQGSQVVVCNNSVLASATGSTAIPANGFVLSLVGSEQSMANRFRPGQKCTFRFEFRSEDNQFWQQVQEAIGAGPRLVKDGKLCLNPKSEGFRSAKILTMAGQRSAVGITKDNKLLMVTCGNATVKQMAEAMKALGSYNAMDLDGGASSCLWANGKYITKPGRNLSNALLIIKR